MANQVTSYLKYANVQMAAEALFVPQSAAPGTTYSGAITSSVLTTGNTRSSRFPTALADQFSQDWTVVEHISNTLLGQGSDDELYGGVGDDTLYGDDRGLLDTPAVVHGKDYLDGDVGAYELRGTGKRLAMAAVVRSATLGSSCYA